MHVSGGLIVADMETLKTNRRLHRRDAEDAEERAFDKHYSELCGLCYGRGSSDDPRHAPRHPTLGARHKSM